jgi:hypothetical protein
MTVSTEVNQEGYTGNGVTTTFGYRFRILKADNLTVTRIDASGVETVLLLGTDYTVTGAGSYSGGNVVLNSALPNGITLTIERNLAIVQETDLRNQGTFFAEVHEDVFDYITMILQQLRRLLSLTLSRATFKSKFFDAKNYPISHLGEPSKPQDATTKNYVDVNIQSARTDGLVYTDQQVEKERAQRIAADNQIVQNFNDQIQKTVRVTDSALNPLPAIESRKNMLIGFNEQGNPVPISDKSVIADLSFQLASNGGAGLVGTLKGKTVQQMLDAVQAGGFDSLDVDGFHARLRQTGMYDLLEVPGSPKGSAGFTFGGLKNKGAIVMDEHARLQGYSFVNNRMVASQIAYPYAHGTGAFNGPFEQSLLHIPVKGAEDDSLHHKMLFGYDEETQRSFAAVVSPFTYGEDGYPTDGFNEQVSRLGFYYDVGYGLNHSFDHFNTTDMAALRWGLLCTIKPGSTGDSGKIFAADITTGSYVEYEPATYSLVVNGQNLIDTAKGGNINRGNISQWIKFVRKEDTSNASLTMNFIPEVGMVYNTSTGNVDVYLKLPFNSPRPSITVKTLANPTYVTVDWSLWGTNALRTTEPGGITYAITYYPVNTQNYVRSNGGEVLYTPNIALRVKDLLTQTSVYSSRHAQYIEYGFSSYGNYHATNKYAGAGITVTKNSTGNYTVNGCTLSGNRWKMKAPITWFGDRAAGIITITATGSGSFSFTLRKRAYIVDTTSATPTVTEGLGDFIDIPDGTWVDFHVTV